MKEPTREEVCENQNENTAIFSAAVKAVDKNIDKVFPEADEGARIASYMTAIDMAVCTYLHDKFGGDKRRLGRMQMDFYKILVRVNEIAMSDTLKDEAMEKLADLAEQFHNDTLPKH